MSKLFLSYRRDDSAHASDRIYEHLKDQRFDVIYDIDTIPKGRDYREYLKGEVAACDVMIVVIGDGWLEVKNDKGQHRIDDPEDWVHIEIEAALEREIPVIPVLVGRHRSMPTASELPSALVGLAYRQAVEVRPGAQFKTQVKLLIRGIKEVGLRTRTVQLWLRTRWAVGALALVLAALIVVKYVLFPSPIPDIAFVEIPAGTFEMGSNEGAVHDQPVHTVTISKPFSMSIHEITQGQWKQVMGTEPWIGEQHVQEGDDHPATYVSWNEAFGFARRLDSLSGTHDYRLPTEAEWEYAARAGSTTEYWFGDEADSLGAYAWYEANTSDVGEKYAHRVGQKRPNGWGLYDMHGNVWEWVSDRFARAVGSIRVVRGGSFSGTARNARSASRNGLRPGGRYYYLGFRLVRTDL